MVWKWVIFGAWAFRVCDFSRVYEVLDFMFEADISVCGMSNGLVEVAVAIWVISWAIRAQWFHID